MSASNASQSIKGWLRNFSKRGGGGPGVLGLQGQRELEGESRKRIHKP